VKIDAIFPFDTLRKNKFKLVLNTDGQIRLVLHRVVLEYQGTVKIA
jgi:hypothetical protein